MPVIRIVKKLRLREDHEPKARLDYKLSSRPAGIHSNALSKKKKKKKKKKEKEQEREKGKKREAHWSGCLEQGDADYRPQVFLGKLCSESNFIFLSTWKKMERK